MLGFHRKKGLEARSRSHDLFVVCVHSIIFAILLGAGINVGFIVDTWFQPVFSAGWLDTVIALAIGALVGYGTYGLFIRSERAIRAILKSPEHRAMKAVRIVAMVILNLGFIGIGVSGLLYRLQFVHTSGVMYLIIIGCILEGSVPLFGLVLHPIQHPPAEALEEERVQDFTTSHVGRMYDTFDRAPIDEQHRVYTAIINDDADAVQDVIDRQVKRSLPAPQVQKVQPEYDYAPQQPRRFLFLTRPWKKGARRGEDLTPFPNAQEKQADSLSKHNGR